MAHYGIIDAVLVFEAHFMPIEAVAHAVGKLWEPLLLQVVNVYNYPFLSVLLIYGWL